MHVARHRRGVRLALVACIGLLAAGAMHASARARHHPRANPPAPVDATVTVTAGSYGQPIPPGFLGLSIEYWAIKHYAGRHDRWLDPVLVKLIRTLTGGHGTVLRIGGVSTDQTWWPARGARRPPGATYTLTAPNLYVLRALAQATRSKLILGVQFEADSAAEAHAESRAMLKYVGRRWIDGFELGNEPELFPFAAYYMAHGAPVYGRPAGWTFQSYLPDYERIAAAIGRLPLAGPATGNPAWMNYLGQYLTAEPDVKVVTLHRYPLEGCSVGPGSPNYPTIPNLLVDPLQTGPEDPYAPFVSIAHAYGVKVRFAEMNSVACGNGIGVANTFASALWVIGALFESASIGIDGVNVHTYPGAPDELFAIHHHRSRWRARVAPEYYGMLMFSQAAPPGSQLLTVSEAGDATALRAWATRTTTGRRHVILINDSLTGAKTVAVTVAGATGRATLEALSAPSASATGGMTLGGRSFGARTSSVKLRGSAHLVRVEPSQGVYVVTLPAASAAMLTLR